MSPAAADAHRASKYARALERESGVLARDAAVAAQQQPERLRELYRGAALRARAAADAWEIAGDAYEIAGDGPNAAWARQQATNERRWARGLGRIRFVLHRSYVTTRHDGREDRGFLFRHQPASLDEVLAEIRLLSGVDRVESRDGEVVIHGDPERERDGSTRYSLHVHGERSGLRRLAQLGVR